MDRTNAERQRRYIARLKQAAARAQAQNKSAQAADTITALEREVIGLKFKLAEARDRAADGGPSDEVLRLRHENAWLRRQLALGRAATKPRPPADSDAEATKLRARIRDLQARLRAVADAPQGAVHMSAADRRKILNCLHPDRRTSASEKQLTEAFQIFQRLSIREA